MSQKHVSSVENKAKAQDKANGYFNETEPERMRTAAAA